ncbi:hypothetical protein [Heyndrickxia acidicola]|uniref:Uncharacterized protein n=1 Tax=Heyndrickxia acidicola TaxID=209389 RepID=A0ABU6MFI7_9BACI|nr:hypothetical protein [Heyndrickxia acidicola]MED1203457.1 hypothetical protein [Heyndrickxia acidicola]
MPLALQAFTTPSNTLVIADTSAPPPPLPTPAVLTTPATPFIDGNNAYIWSPNNASGQTVTFQTDFIIPGLPIGVALGLSAFYAFAANETATVTANLQIVNNLGIVILDIPLFTASNGGNPENVVSASGDALLAAGILDGNTARIRVDATVTAPVTLPYEPANTGRYLGEIIVRDIVGIG